MKRTTPLPPPIRALEDGIRTAVFAVSIDRAAIEAERAAGETDDGTIPITFSSEYPVERYDWWENERYLEILEHSSAAIDLTRAASGLPFLYEHSRYEQLGRVTAIALRADGKLAGRLRFSQRPEAQLYRHDVLDGICGEVSVGYRIDPTRVDVVTADGKLPEYRVRRWTPIEVSGVSIPADPTVGANRSDTPPAGALRRPTLTRADAVVSTRALPTTTDSRTDAPSGQEPPMEPENSTAPNTGGTTAVVVNRSEAPDEATRRRALAEQAEKHQVTDVFARGQAAGRSIDEIGRDIMQALRERAERGPQFGGGVQLTEGEAKRYSIARAIFAASGELDSGFEIDVSQQIARNLPQGYKPNGSGVFFPTNLPVMALSESQRAAIVAGTGTIGGNLTFTQPGSFIELLRNKTMVLQAGATLLPGLRSSVSFPKQSGSGTFYWVGENSGSDVTESNMTFALVSLTPKTGAATQAFSRQLLTQAEHVPEIEQLMRNDLVSIHARAIDLSAIAGLGSSNQPLGVTKNTGVGTVALGTHGAVPTYDTFVDLEVAIANGNVDGTPAYLTTPSIAGKLKKTQKFATTNGEAVWNGGLVMGAVNGGRGFGTKQVPSTLTKGTSTTICHAIVAGVFEHLMIGEFGAAEIITDVFSKKKQGLIEVTSFQMVDVALRYDEAFQVVLDARLS